MAKGNPSGKGRQNVSANVRKELRHRVVQYAKRWGISISKCAGLFLERGLEGEFDYRNGILIVYSDYTLPLTRTREIRSVSKSRHGPT